MKRILVFAAAAASVMVLRADSSQWELVSLLPFPVSEGGGDWQQASLKSMYQTGGGFSEGGTPENQPVSQDLTHDRSAFRLEHGSWGFGVSELRADFNIGDCCTDFPEGTIDWEATCAAITNSQAYAEGYLFYDDSASSPEKRVLFTRGGEVSVPWKLAGGVDASQVYTVGHTSVARPYRIFWTEQPFSGPKIDLSAHPDVRLLGDPAIVKPLYATTHTSDQTGVSNIVRGVVFDATAKVLRSYCRVINEATREYDGPVGQFVLAYYDSGQMDNLVATIVVEACPPDVDVINASVGAELRPSGGGYDIEGLEAEIHAGDDPVQGDAVAPYLYKHKGETNWSPKNGAVFAIAPTDSTTTKTGESAPWRADIYWKAPDPLDVLWPFEEDWYEISWPKDAPAFVVSGSSSAPGLPIFAPTNLTVSVCAYQSPANIAKADSGGCVSATSAGMFTIKLAGDDNIWFQPVQAFVRTDPAIAMTNAVSWTIGNEIALLGGTAARNTEEAARDADGSLPGYIYSGASTGRRNWNPTLYHEPTQSKVSDGVEGTPSESPFAKLNSAIYPVNISSDPIEVWWSSRIRQGGMSGELKVPCVVQRYMAQWPDPRDVQTIVIASQKGSDGDMSGSSPSALYLNDPADSGFLSTDDELDPNADDGFTFGFWASPAPRGAGAAKWSGGLLATLYGREQGSALTFRLGGSAEEPKLFVSSRLGALQEWADFAGVPLKAGEWTHVVLALGAAEADGSRPAKVYANAQEVATSAEKLSVPSLTNGLALAIGAWAPTYGGTPDASAHGVAMDGISAWSAELTADQIRADLGMIGGSAEANLALQCNFQFDSENDLVQMPGTPDRVSYDSLGVRTLYTVGPLKLSPGAPALTSGIVTSDSGVTPSVYYENDPNAVGFNPNDEHAFLLQGPKGWIVHALRCDLASEGGSQPLVLVQYGAEGKGAMRSALRSSARRTS